MRSISPKEILYDYLGEYADQFILQWDRANSARVFLGNTSSYITATLQTRQDDFMNQAWIRTRGLPDGGEFLNPYIVIWTDRRLLKMVGAAVTHNNTFAKWGLADPKSHQQVQKWLQKFMSILQISKEDKV